MKKNERNKGDMPLPNQKIYDLAMKTAGNVKSFAEMLGVAQQSVDRLFKQDKRNGKYPSISPAIKEALKKKMGIDEIYLLTAGNVTNSGTMLTVDGNQNISNSHHVTMTNSNNVNIGGVGRDKMTVDKAWAYNKDVMVSVPYIPIDAKASFIESLDTPVYDMDSYSLLPEIGEDLLSGEYVVFQVSGDSMLPIQDKTKILAKVIHEEKWEEASGVVFVAYGKMLTIKRVLKNSLYGKNVLILKADNPSYGQMDVERSEIRGIWQAVRIISQDII